MIELSWDLSAWYLLSNSKGFSDCVLIVLDSLRKNPWSEKIIAMILEKLNLLCFVKWSVLNHFKVGIKPREWTLIYFGVTLIYLLSNALAGYAFKKVVEQMYWNELDCIACVLILLMRNLMLYILHVYVFLFVCE